MLTRATFAGGQRWAAMWPGDNVSRWADLRGSLPLLLGMGLSGLPFVGVDVGGFARTPSAASPSPTATASSWSGRSASGAATAG